jgi:hypothetical protein
MQEPSTCNYVVNVATSLLCTHPDFRIEEKPDYAITCREVDLDAAEGEGELQLDPPSWLQDSATSSSPSPPPAAQDSPAERTEL